MRPVAAPAIRTLGAMLLLNGTGVGEGLADGFVVGVAVGDADGTGVGVGMTYAVTVPLPRLVTKILLVESIATPFGLFSCVREPAMKTDKMGDDVVVSGVKTRMALLKVPLAEVLATTRVPSLTSAMPCG